MNGTNGSGAYGSSGNGHAPGGDPFGFYGNPFGQEPDTGGGTNGKNPGNGHGGGTGAGTRHQDEPILCEQLEPLPITSIPPRTWAYGHFLLFGHASVLGAVDGGGKGGHAVAIALSMITGRELLGEKVWRTGPVVIVTYEDDKMEWRRRIAAACLHYGIDYDSVIRSFYFISRPRSRISFAARIGNAGDGSKIGFPDSEAIIAHLKAIRPALFIVDPFNRAHALEDGNSNVMIALVAGEISRIAAETLVAAMVLHHLRKGSTGQLDDLMGATALRATFRATRILVGMTREEAEGFELPTAEAWRYSKIASTKANYTPPETARWYVSDSVKLGNIDVDPTYPEGDSIAVIATWNPPDAFEGLSRSAIAEILTALRTGPEPGEFYTKHRNANERWAGWPIVKISSKSTAEAARIIKAWLKSSTLIEDEKYLSPKTRKYTGRIVVNEGKAAAILGSLYRPPETAS